MASPQSSDAYAALRIAPFRTFLVVRFVMTIAVQIQSIAVGCLVYEATRDPLALGLIGLCEAIPSIAVALFAGHAADVLRRKTIALCALIVLCFCSINLLFFTLSVPALAQSGRVLAEHHLPAHLFSVSAIYGTVFVSGLARGFLGPATSGMVAQLVPRELYANSTAWASSSWQTASVAGPALGGLIYGFFGARAAFGIDAFLMFAALFGMMLVPKTPIVPPENHERVLTSIASGLRFVFSNQVIWGALSLDLFAVLFGGAVALLPVFSAEILRGPPWQLGVLRAAPAVGAVLMGLHLAHHPLPGRAGKRMLFAVAGFGVTIIAFALSRNFYLSLAILALGGAFDSISVLVRHTLIQLHTPDAMRGRVAAVNNIFIGSSNEIGEFESGVMARLMGTVPSVIFGGVMTLLVVGMMAFLAPKLRDMDQLSD